MKALLIKGMTLMGVAAVMFGTLAATSAQAEGRFNGRSAIHHRHRHHRHWHQHIGR